MSGCDTIYSVVCSRGLIADPVWLVQMQAQHAAEMQALAAGLGMAALAGSAIMAANRIHEGYQQAEQLGIDQAIERMQEHQRQQQALAERMVGLAQAADRAERCEQRLRALAAQFGVAGSTATDPTRPPCGDVGAMQAYVEALAASCDGIENALAESAATLRASGKTADLARLAGADAGSIDDLMAAFAEQAKLHEGLSAEQVAAYLEHAGRIVKRLGIGIPARLEIIMQELALARTEERAESLLAELRLQVQRESERQSAQAKERAAAQEALAGIPVYSLFDPLRQALALAAAGVTAFDERLRGMAERALETGRQIEQEERDRAAAAVLDQSLKDLGYTVEPVAETLFTEGGMVHFQREGWGDYYVRMRVDAEQHSANLHVVRAAAADAPSQLVQDIVADNRWCSEFPKLRETLAARGLNLEVQRQLEGGELAVPRIDREKVAGVPRHAEEADRATAFPGARALGAAGAQGGSAS